MSETPRIVVLASGSGTNLQAIIDAMEIGKLPVKITAVCSDNKNAYALVRAKAANIPTLLHLWNSCKSAGKSRDQYDADLAQLLLEYQPDFVILAGWMRLLSMSFLSHFPMQVINLHPALPGTFPGTHAIQRAFEAFHDGQITETGVMVHFVPDEGVDSGPVITQRSVPLKKHESLEQLEERIHNVEHEILVNALIEVVTTKSEKLIS